MKGTEDYKDLITELEITRKHNAQLSYDNRALIEVISRIANHPGGAEEMRQMALRALQRLTQ